MINGLRDESLLCVDAHVNGQWVSSDARTPVVNPATGDVIAEVADLGAGAAQNAIEAARAAQPAWAAKTALERSDILRRWAKLMRENADDLGRILTAEMGKPLAEAKGEIGYGASFLDWFAEEGRRIYGDTIPGHQPDKRILVLKQPIGVAASITPWNFPNAMIARKVAPALAAGCTFVARPSELTPLSALAMAELGVRAGLPAGVFNVVTSADAAGIGKVFCDSPVVRKISFTGSTRVGQILMEQSAKHLKKLSLELGGNAPFIVFNDADLDAAVEGALIAKFRNAGQTCVCANRIYAQSGIYEAFTEKLAAKVSALKVGDGAEAGTVIGPLINAAAVEKVEMHLSDALSQGAQLLCGGRRIGNDTLFFEPSVLTGVTPDMRCSREETFGPLAPVIPFDTEEEVLALANDSEYGLASYFYTTNLGRTFRVLEALEYGMVGVNTGLTSTAEAPFGGIKTSGLGREGSKYGIEDYLEIKYACLSI
ncbi:NAD-dependent succinate-semialdehyde dehydrogenase [Celeribacter sp. PS-C1]|uniref:NAD-dependent succinate-semialdehyde dehydrogenase n=1 Tax=Celeribacter sp. PS-C1 TaxID=2820813 RepID=UPI001C68190B|nr:NAD-dependent succinate-semialdehyde dehydrogenase [Celeribacter sp. PS-C1]MBW6419624.1 NAD-dependent succinate-semialdehyde dehydrogenase [Celeribacter sp. PS-C1]